MADRRKSVEPDYALDIGIVGGGATGVELAAELLEACADAAFYGLNKLEQGKAIRINLLEGSARIRSALQANMSAANNNLMVERGEEPKTSLRVAQQRQDVLLPSMGQAYR